MAAPLRIGILGAARIAPMALIRPAKQVPEAAIVAVAARDPARAHKFAAKHGIARVADSYAALIADPEIDAIYNPLPNSLHAEWSIKALEAGKDVLCEKPLASNAEEAQAMADAAVRCQRFLGEAFHYRYHPLAARMKAIVESGALGSVQHIAISAPRDRWEEVRDKLDAAGVKYAGPDLGIEESMYFKDPDGIQIELLSDPLMYFGGQQLDE